MDMGLLLGIFFGDGTLLAGDFMVCNKEALSKRAIGVLWFRA